MKYLMYVVLLSLIAIGAVLLLREPKAEEIVTTQPTALDEDSDAIELCFAKFEKFEGSDFEDKYTLRLVLDGEHAEGELKFMPAEKDSKAGAFSGTVTPVDKISMSRTANLLWQSYGEGMLVPEELSINFGEGIARIGTGGMVDRGDGTYKYADPSAIDYSFELSDIDCKLLNERESLESYLRENIETLSPVGATFGGKWYVVSYSVDTALDTGVVSYEDGHIQEKRLFTYTTDEKGMVTGLIIKE